MSDVEQPFLCEVLSVASLVDHVLEGLAGTEIDGNGLWFGKGVSGQASGRSSGCLARIFILQSG